MFRSLRFFVYVGTADYEKLRFLDIGELTLDTAAQNHWQKLTNVAEARLVSLIECFLISSRSSRRFPVLARKMCNTNVCKMNLITFADVMPYFSHYRHIF